MNQKINVKQVFYVPKSLHLIQIVIEESQLLFLIVISRFSKTEALLYFLYEVVRCVQKGFGKIMVLPGR